MKLRKLGAGALVLAMAAGMLAGCGSSSSSSSGSSTASTASASSSTEAAASSSSSANTGDMVTVKVAFPGLYDTTDAPMVQDAINQILAEKYGIQCEITFIDFGSWTQQSNLLLTGDGVDVICYWTMPLSTYVNNKQVLPLDDYLATADDEFKNLFSEEEWKACQVNGVQYTVPNLRNYGSVYGLVVKDGVLEEMGMTTDDISSLDDVDAFLEKARAQYPDLPYLICPQSTNTMVNGWTWDGLGDQNFVGVIGNCGNDTEVKDIFELEDYQELCRHVYSWSQNGYLMSDVLSNQDTGDSLLENGQAICFLTNMGYGQPQNNADLCPIIPNWTDSTNVAVLTYGINPLSKNPDQAFTLLQALYIDSDVQNLLMNGIEGTHYTVNDDGSLAYADGKSATSTTYGVASQYWAMPYAKADVPSYQSMDGTPNYFAHVAQFNEESAISPATGFVYDSESVSDQMTACLNTLDKYYRGLLGGVLDPDTTFEQAHQEMVDSGIEDIISVKQAALDELLANK